MAGSGVLPGSLMLSSPDRDGRLRWLGRAGSGLAGPTGTIVAGRLRHPVVRGVRDDVPVDAWEMP